MLAKALVPGSVILFSSEPTCYLVLSIELQDDDEDAMLRFRTLTNTEELILSHNVSPIEPFWVLCKEVLSPTPPQGEA